MYPAPLTCKWDVFISHAGNGADKPFALALYDMLQRTGWGLNVFLDDRSLQYTRIGWDDIVAAIDSTAIAVMLFSPEFFERDAPKAELKQILARHARDQLVVLPVFLRMRVEECNRKAAVVMEQGASTVHVCCQSGTDIQHAGAGSHVVHHAYDCEVGVHAVADGLKLPNGIRHLGEYSMLPQRNGTRKTERETLWEIVRFLSRELLKDFAAGCEKYASTVTTPQCQER